MHGEHTAGAMESLENAVFIDSESDISFIEM
jgi:hypothetical protein